MKTILMKIKTLISRKYPKPFCKKCRYYIPYCEWVKLISGEKLDGRHICGQTLLTEINELGDEVFKKYGDKELCPECKTLLNDHRRPVFRSCLVKNHLNKCKDFTPRPIFHILRNTLKTIIIKLMDKINSIRVNDFFTLIVLIAFQAWFIIQTGVFTAITFKQLITFCIVEGVLFIYLIKKK